MFIISQAFSYLSSSSFQQTLVYLCSIQVSFSVCIFQRFNKFLKIYFLKKVFSQYFKASFFFYKVAIGFEPNCVTNGNKSS